MNKKIYQYSLILVFSFFAFLSYSQDAKNLDKKVDDILAQMPAGDLVSLDGLMGELIESGPDGFRKVSTLLTAPGVDDDTSARFAIASLARYSSAPGREEARVVVENGILEALESHTDAEIKTFLMNQLNLAGSDRSVTALKKYQTDEYLAEPARQAITSIGSTRTVGTGHVTVLTKKEKAKGFVLLFNGKDLEGWQGNTTDYFAEGGELVVQPSRGGHGNLYTGKEYSDFIFRFEFQLTPGANNGLGIRAPLEGDAAYMGMELQILDNTAPVYASLQEYQYHGSVYGVIPAKRGCLRPVGEWNEQEVIAKGTRITITLNGTVILDGDIAKASKNGTIDGKEHPGLVRKKGHIGFLGHGSELKFRNIRIKELSK